MSELSWQLSGTSVSKIFRYYHSKLMNTESVADTGRNGSITRSDRKVQVVWDILCNLFRHKVRVTVHHTEDEKFMLRMYKGYHLE